jgi:hypothetical protein
MKITKVGPIWASLQRADDSRFQRFLGSGGATCDCKPKLSPGNFALNVERSFGSINLAGPRLWLEFGPLTWRLLSFGADGRNTAVPTAESELNG